MDVLFTISTLVEVLIGLVLFFQFIGITNRLRELRLEEQKASRHSTLNPDKSTPGEALEVLTKAPASDMDPVLAALCRGMRKTCWAYFLSTVVVMISWMFR